MTCPSRAQIVVSIAGMMSASILVELYLAIWSLKDKKGFGQASNDKICTT